jgi:hypothetical protein
LSHRDAGQIEDDLREAPIDEIVDPLPERQIPIIEQHLASQEEDRHVTGLPLVDR